MIKPNVDPNPSKLSTYADERIFLNAVNLLRRQCDDGWTKKTCRVREVHNGGASDDVNEQWASGNWKNSCTAI